MPALNRRRFLHHSALAAGLLVAGPTLSACGRSAAGPSTSGSAASVRGVAGPSGATVRVGLLGSPTDTLDMTTAATALPFLVGYHVFDSLALVDGAGFRLQLAEAITPNTDGTRWTITTRPAAVFSDGRPVTATDVLFSLGWLAGSPVYGPFFADLDLAASKVVAERTVELALSRPRGDLLEATLSQVSFVIPDGTTDFTAPVGSGPFVVESFSPDTGAVLVRNEKYWGEPALPDRLEIRAISDAGARLAALTDGQLDLALDITGTGAQTLQGVPGVRVLDSELVDSAAMIFYLNSRMAPFDDPDVREAVKLAVDRAQLVDVVLLGRGQIGNDVLGAGLPGFDDTLTQRTQQQERARQLLAGKNLGEIGLLVGELTTGLTAASELLVQQLAEVGLTVTISTTDPSTMFNDIEALTRLPILASYVINRPVAVNLTTYTGSTSPYSFSGWGTPEYDRLLTTAQTAVDPAARQEALRQAQQLLWAEGGDLLWGYKPNLNASVDTLTGLTFSQSVPLLTTARYT